MLSPMLDDSSECPRILFIGGQPPSSVHAGCIFFYRLFSTWPSQRLQVATSRMPDARANRLTCNYSQIVLPFERLGNTRLWKWRFVARLAGAARFASIKEIDALGNFNPDLIVTVMIDSLMYQTAALYAQSISCPLLVFVHDLSNVFEPLPKPFSQAQFYADRKFLRKAKKVFVISKGMKQYIANTFGIDSDIFLPLAGPSLPTTVSSCSVLKQPGHLTVGYAGGLHYGYGDQIAAMASAFRRAGASLEVFGADFHNASQDLQNASDVVRLNGSMGTPEAAWDQIRKRCDVVLLPYLNPPGRHELQYRTHFPSKLADMVSLGLPILMTGPRYASGIEWSFDTPNSSLCVTVDDQDLLVDALVRLRNNQELRGTLAEGARSRISEFNPETLQTKFRNIARTICYGR